MAMELVVLRGNTHLMIMEKSNVATAIWWAMLGMKSAAQKGQGSIKRALMALRVVFVAGIGSLLTTIPRVAENAAI
jgi:hypothetical protein